MYFDHLPALIDRDRRLSTVIVPGVLFPFNGMVAALPRPVPDRAMAGIMHLYHDTRIRQSH